MRDYYGDVGIFGEPLNAIPFYSLYSDRTCRTSHIIDFKNSPHYKELIDFVHQYGDEIMKNIIDGKEYIN